MEVKQKKTTKLLLRLLSAIVLLTCVEVILSKAMATFRSAEDGDYSYYDLECEESNKSIINLYSKQFIQCCHRLSPLCLPVYEMI